MSLQLDEVSRKLVVIIWYRILDQAMVPDLWAYLVGLNTKFTDKVFILSSIYLLVLTMTMIHWFLGW
jgi:hypothetical protein